MGMQFNHRNQSQSSRRQRPVATDHAPVYSYYARRSQEQSILGRQIFREVIQREAAVRTARFSLRRLGLFSATAIGLIACVSLLWLTPNPVVVPLTTDRTAFLHDPSIYQRAAAQLFASSFMNGNKVTVDAAGIGVALKRQFPELGVASVSLPLFGHRPVVYIAPTDIRLRLRVVTGKVYNIDGNGRAIGEVSGSAQYLDLPLVEDQSGASVTIGRPVLSSDTVTFVRTVAFQVQQQHLVVSKFTLPSGESELDLYVSGQPYYVKFNLADASALQQVGSFLAVRHHLAGEGKAPTQYIDVRLTGRAYYK